MDKKDANELPIQCRSLNYYGHTLDFFSWEEEVEKQVKEEMQKIKENSASDSNVKRQVENQQESDQHRKRSKHDSGKKSSTTDKVGQDSSTKGNFEEQREISAFVKRRDASQSAQLLVKTRFVFVYFLSSTYLLSIVSTTFIVTMVSFCWYQSLS